MRKQIGHRFGFVTAALVVLGSSASGASDPKEQQLSEVVMKSLDTKPLVDGHAVSTGAHTFAIAW